MWVFCFLCFGFRTLCFDIFCLFAVLSFVFYVLVLFLCDDDKFLGAVLKVSGGGKIRNLNVNGETKFQFQLLYVLV